jgi:hypothetical protein
MPTGVRFTLLVYNTSGTRSARSDLAMADGQVLRVCDPGSAVASAGRAEDAGGTVAIFEAIRRGGRPVLLAVFAHNVWRLVQINGHPALPAHSLGPGDVIRFPSGFSLKVGLDLAPRVGRPAPELVGRPCSLCRGEITAETTVLVCSSCGAALHMEGAEIPESARLQCAKLASACPRCSAPIPHEVERGGDHGTQE